MRVEGDGMEQEMDQGKESKLQAEQAGRKTIDLAPWTAELFARSLTLLRPPPELTLSQWADQYRVLSAENSASPGRWDTSRAPYQREIMDAMGDVHLRKVVVMCAAQIGKTAMLMNLLGYYMHYYPAPVLVMQPTIELGETFSKDFLSPMLRDTPVLSPLVDVKSKYAGNTILKKNFPGGHVTIVGANSPISLRSRPIKVLLADEVDGYPESAGTEGDPLMLAEKRQTTFWDKKEIVVSTPTLKGISRIEKEFLDSTREEWNVPCPGCGHYQPLAWANIKYDKEDLSCIFHRCERCGELYPEYDWKAKGVEGKFVAANPGAETRGFHLNTLASSFCAWKEVVEKFIQAKRSLDIGDPHEMMVWTNTEMGEVWEEQGVQVEPNELYTRREPYGVEVPEDVLVLTAGVDTQDDRFEVEVVGWGVGKESWGIRYQRIYGEMEKPQIWEDLDNFLQVQFHKADGTTLGIECVCMDAQGHYFNEVCRWTKERNGRRIYAIRGKAGMDIPYIPLESRNNRVKAPMFNLGVDVGKSQLFHRLSVAQRGPNYCHFPLDEDAGYDETYFKGLCAERQYVKFKKGKRTVYWDLRDRSYQRNEPLDLRNYATAALEILRPVLQPGAHQIRVRRGRRILGKGL